MQFSPPLLLPLNMSLQCVWGGGGIHVQPNFLKRCQEGKQRLLIGAQITEVVGGGGSGVNLLL